MPHVINGIGTWYWGKRNMRVRRGACQFCGRVADLRSYDTTLFFVVLFMPVVPLKKLHIMEECSACKKHRVASLRKWESMKKEVLGNAVRECHEHPDDPEKIRGAIGACIGFEDEAAFAEVASVAADTMATDAEVQGALGSAYQFFGHRDLAELAYRTSLNLKDDSEVAMRLGVHLLRSGQPEEGWGIIRPLVTSQFPDRIATAYLAAMAFQAEGKHDAAIGVLDHAASVQPGLAKDKEFQKLRRGAEKNRASGKKVKSDLLRGGSTELRERRIASRVPLVIALLILAGLVGGYFWGSWYRGTHRTVYLVSGLDDTSTVTIDSTDVALIPFAVHKITLAEGTHKVRASMDGRAGEEATISFSTPFFTRLFEHRTFVINADRLALIEWEKAVYTPRSSGSSPVQPDMKVYAGEAFYDFAGIDYEFDVFPPRISTQQSSGAIAKERIDNVQSPSVVAAWSTVSGALGEGPAREWIKRAAALKAADPDVYYVLLASLAPDEALAVIQPLLKQRPVLVEPHRAYQELTERTKPEHDLTAEYRGLLGASPDDSALQYLLGRVVHNVGEADELFRRATKGAKPVARAYTAIAFQRMSVGRFEEGAAATQQGLGLAPGDTQMQEMERDVLLAMGKYDELLSRAPYTDGTEDTAPAGAMTRASLLAAGGKRAAAEAWLAEYQSMLQREGDQSLSEVWRKCADATMAYGGGDAGPLARLGESSGTENLLDTESVAKLNFEWMGIQSALTGGRLEEAAKRIGDDGASDTWVSRLLLSIAAGVAGQVDMAAAQAAEGAKGLAKGGWEDREAARWLEQTEAPDLVKVLTLPMAAREKAVVLTALGIRFEAIRGPVFEMAGKLNFDPGFPRLLLKSAIEKQDWGR